MLRTLLHTLLHIAALVAAGSLVAAQVAQSPGYRLLGLELDAGGGGSASSTHAAFVTLQDGAGAGLDSGLGGAAVGFVAIHDPTPTILPVVFAVSPSYGPEAGGTAVTISGLNFTKGTGSVTADVDGNPLTSVQVVSDMQLQALTPPGTRGPRDVGVQTSLGSTMLAGGFVYTPAVVAPPAAAIGGLLDLENYGEPGGVFDLYYSNVTTQIPVPPYGELLIGPTPLITLAAGQSYPAPDGVALVQVPVPNTPALVGQSLHFQSLAVLSFAPLDLQLTNRASVVFQ